MKKPAANDVARPRPELDPTAVPAVFQGGDFHPVEVDTKPAPMVLCRPSMSHTDLLLQCQWPFSREVPYDAPGEEAVFGTGYHGLMATAMQHNVVEVKAKGDPALLERVNSTLAELRPWLRGGNPWKVDWIGQTNQIFIERSMAYNPNGSVGRFISNPDESHVYHDASRHELPGTLDFASLPDRPKVPLLILDYKTGYEVGTPLESGQLKSIALAFSDIHSRSRVVIGFVHAPSNSRPTIYADEIDPKDLRSHGLRLREAFSRIGDGSLRPGDHCRYCPGRSICPTQTNALAALKSNPNQALTSERVGAIHQALNLYDGLSKTLREQIRSWVKDNGPAVRPDGKVVDLVSKAFSNLSQASIMRAMGPIEGGKELERLEKAGAIERGERMELRAEPERGK